MKEMTISEVSRSFQVSARMLRHYEKLGMLQSSRREGYAYRVYDEESVRRVRQIVILRKLQIPLKKIQAMLEGDRAAAIRILEEQLYDLGESAKALRRKKALLEKLLEWIRQAPWEEDRGDFAQEKAIVALAELLPLEKHQLKEEKTMAETKEMMEKGSAVRIVQLPPFTVASYQYIGESPEEKAGEMIDRFVRSSRLYEKKPDARLFGFNHPNPTEGNPVYGYELWATIPEDMGLPEPLVKKDFPGGLYAAYAINFPDFFEWQFLARWVEENETYQPDYSPLGLEIMGGCLEEHLNWVYSAHMGWPENGIDGKLDLLLPIKGR